VADREQGSTVLGVMAISAWLGAAVFLSAVVAPAAFSVLPNRTVAGELIGTVLPVLFFLGVVLGLAIVVLEVRPPRWPHWFMRMIGGALIALACGVAQFGIAPRIARVREDAIIPLDSLDPGSAVRAEFGRLHTISVAWLGVAILAAVSVLFFAWLGLRISRNETAIDSQNRTTET
jgi:hypothetical protein